jgi:hypothetical protein
VVLRHEQIIVAGHAPNGVQGLLDLAPTFTYTPPGTDTAMDAVASAIGQLQGAGYVPDLVIFESE